MRVHECQQPRRLACPAFNLIGLSGDELSPIFGDGRVDQAAAVAG
jgi:hypothetical protein